MRMKELPQIKVSNSRSSHFSLCGEEVAGMVATGPRNYRKSGSLHLYLLHSQ